MRKQEVEKLIYGQIKAVIGNQGFKLKRSEEAFFRSFPDGMNMVSIALYDYHDRFSFSLTLGIRLDLVEDIFNKFSGVLPRSHSLTCTIMTQLSYFTDGKQKEFPASTEEELAESLKSVSDIIKDRILPSFDRYRDVTSLDHAVNSGKYSGFDSTRLPSGAMHAIILAHLAQNPSFDILVEQYQDQMKSFVQVEKDKFNRLVEYLRSQ